MVFLESFDVSEGKLNRVKTWFLLIFERKNSKIFVFIFSKSYKNRLLYFFY